MGGFHRFVEENPSVVWQAQYIQVYLLNETVASCSAYHCVSYSGLLRSTTLVLITGTGNSSSSDSSDFRMSYK
jgi:hypothetical protein